MENLEKESKYTPEKEKKHKKYQIKSNNKTMTINDETDREKYLYKTRKDQFIDFCWEKRSLKKVRQGRLKLLSENGEQYALIQCKLWDCPEGHTERNELRLENVNGESTNDDFNFNENYRYKFSFKIPENFPLSPTRLVIWQWKYNKIKGSNENENPSPILAQRIKKIDWKYYFIITDWKEPKNILWKIPFDNIKGKWVDMEYELIFSDKKDKNGKPIPCIAKIKAIVEWKREMYEEKEFYLADENNLQFNSKESHTGYFKFWLYRDTYDYTHDTKNLSEEDKEEIEKAKNTEKENPMQIYFKNFSMENLSYQDREQERDKSKQADWKQLEQKKSELLKDVTKKEILDNDKKTEKKYIEAFINIIENNIELLKQAWYDLSIVNYLKNWKKYSISINDIENIYNILWYISSNSKDRWLRKFCYEPETMEEFNTFNCSWASLLMTSIINKLWWTVHLLKVYHHYVCIVKIGDQRYLVDTLNKKNKNITEEICINKINEEINEITVKEWENLWEYLGWHWYRKWYIFNSISLWENTAHKWNYEKLLENDKLKNNYKEIIDFLWWDDEIKKKIEWYVSTDINLSFPKDDKKEFKLSKTNNPIKKIIIMLKYNKFFIKMKKRFTNKK